MQQVKLILAYDGSPFKGWQDNKKDLSIEAILRSAVERIQQHPAQLSAASRTDAGVHAEGQVVTFFTPCLRKNLNSFVLSLNALLPVSIRALDASLVPLSFHPSLDAQAKEYHYWISCAPFLLPRLRWTTWHAPGKMDIDSMQQAASYLVGTHSFSAFCNQQSRKKYTDTLRTLHQVDVEWMEKDLMRLRIIGSRFLYNMARTIAGTLAYVGKGKLTAQSIQDLLKSGQRPEAGITAPAHGLVLHQVFYENFSL